MKTTLQGQPIDERTEVVALPLPHINNWHEDDVPRLRTAFELIDAAVQLLGLELDTKADQTALQALSQATSRELASAVSALSGSVNALQLNKVGVVNGLTGPDVTLKPVHLGLGPANGPSQMTINNDEQGRIASVSTSVGGMVALQTLDYDAQDRVGKVTTRYDGRTRTETYTYNPDGSVAGMAAVEA